MAKTAIHLIREIHSIFSDIWDLGLRPEVQLPVEAAELNLTRTFTR